MATAAWPQSHDSNHNNDKKTPVFNFDFPSHQEGENRHSGGNGIGINNGDGSECTAVTDNPRVAGKGSKDISKGMGKSQRQRLNDQGQGLEVRVRTNDTPLGGSGIGRHQSNGGGNVGGNVIKGVNGTTTGIKTKSAIGGVSKNTSVRFAKHNNNHRSSSGNHVGSPSSVSTLGTGSNMSPGAGSNMSPGAGSTMSPGASVDSTTNSIVTDNSNNHSNTSNDLMQATAPIGSLLGSKIGLSTTFAIPFTTLSSYIISLM